MTINRFKYCLSVIFCLSAFTVFSQSTNQSNQSVVTIVGDAPETNNDPHDFINSNPYTENTEPQIQQQMTSQNIEPTLENGFHIRFELNQASQEYNIKTPDTPSLTSSGFSSGSSGGGSASVGKAKKHTTPAEERAFNTKKKMKRWLPKRKKRYRPHLCGRF